MQIPIYSNERIFVRNLLTISNDEFCCCLESNRHLKGTYPSLPNRDRAEEKDSKFNRYSRNSLKHRAVIDREQQFPSRNVFTGTSPLAPSRRVFQTLHLFKSTRKGEMCGAFSSIQILSGRIVGNRGRRYRRGCHPNRTALNPGKYSSEFQSIVAHTTARFEYRYCARPT